MPSYDIVGLVTDDAQRRILLSLAKSTLAASGCIGVTHYSLGNQGHDPVDPFNARTPDVTMTTPIDQVISPPLPITDTIVDQSSELFPTFQVIVPPGLATGIISSIYLWGTVFNDPAVEAELNPYGFTSISPPTGGYNALTFLPGVPRYEDLPTPPPITCHPSTSGVGCACHVAIEEVDYYWNGTTWKPIHERFLFSITNTPQTIKFEADSWEFRITLQFG
jgi:hypothetical protein